MMIFLTNGKEYRGTSALEIVRSIRADASDYIDERRPIRNFLLWSLDRMGDQIPPRELDLSDRVDDETLALTYLFLCDEFGAGRVFVPESGPAAHRR